eukprot:7318200-Pyramimonas_sp.AAC.1
MQEPHGPANVAPIFEVVTPKSKLADVTKHPVVNAASERIWFVGLLPTYVDMGFESDLLGSTKYFYEGSMKVIYFKGADLKSKIGQPVQGGSFVAGARDAEGRRREHSEG